MKTKRFRSFVGILLLVMFSNFGFLTQRITVYLIGDSTIAHKDLRAFPETGWETPFASFFDETVTIDNQAMNGRSSRTFIDENRWRPIADQLKLGDFVLIQFGHNDEVSTKKSYTTETEFKANLKRFITETQVKQANAF